MRTFSERIGRLFHRMGAKLVKHIRFVRQKKGDQMMYCRVPGHAARYPAQRLRAWQLGKGENRHLAVPVKRSSNALQRDYNAAAS